MAFCNTCIRSTDSSYVQRPSLSIKTILRRQLLKKSSTISRSPIRQSCGRFQRIKGTNFVREINPESECFIKTDTTNNYDMTRLHDDTLTPRRSKKIPRWARKSQLQLAIVNQLYFNENKPEDLFGSINIDVAREMVQSIDLYSTSNLPPNFV